ncbi:hypothetical protein ASG31_04610 [Chryseobacterium sp. Leaf404]|uniref:hypothetical protein n=1 Tax=unclassified Chryseobacterium TaxID=2593645 RepID=UPI0006FDC400|nr:MULTISPECIES: hypothetical protein [unclassified Chryseobacterium]KQT18025.1 hypothetical protein ASG31_04610 [Chryseobacterium sp. Leaf404]
MIRKIALPFILISFALFNAQQNIPFRLTKHNNIIVKTLVNDKDSLHLMFQIAMEDASISPERIRKADHIIFKDIISDGNTVKIGQRRYKNIRFYNNELTGHEADGKIGIAIFKDKFFKIDYDRSEFIVYNKEPDLKGYDAIDLKVENGQYFIPAESIIDLERPKAYFLLQSGYSGGLMYSNQFADDNKLDEKLFITGEKSLKNSAGQTITTKQGILPFLKIGSHSLSHVSVGFFTGDIQNQKTNYLAADVMRRFNWIFDKERKKVYIKPSKYFKKPYYKIS